MLSILAAGDQIGTHSWDHPNFTTLTAAQTTTEISQARSLQVAVTGRDSKLFRFPYNQATTAALSYLSSQGMQSIGADIDRATGTGSRSPMRRLSRRSCLSSGTERLSSSMMARMFSAGMAGIQGTFRAADRYQGSRVPVRSSSGGQLCYPAIQGQR